MSPDSQVARSGRFVVSNPPDQAEAVPEADRPPGHRFLSHTADTAFEAWGPQRATCYAEAVRALVASFAEVTHAQPVDRRLVDFGPAADEDLLVDLLEEVIYLLDARGLVAIRAELRDSEDGGLHGQLELAEVSSVQASGAVPKAVTYHALEVEAGAAGWRCRVTIDV